VLNPDDLYELDRTHLPVDAGGRGPVLVHVLDGFVDAGRAGKQVVDELLGELEHDVVARFDVDQLLDYRSRRPPMVFAADRWETYQDPELTLRLVRDQSGVPFLLLSGAEPDVQWERFTAAVATLVKELGVRLTLGLSSIPMAVPHTRPIGVTAHATSPGLVSGDSPWVGTVRVPGSAAALLELRLGEAGHDAAGFAVHVPHYLAQTDYPEAALVLMTRTAELAELALPTENLRPAAERVMAEVQQQVDQSDEVGAVVRALENQYDAMVRAQGRSLLADDETALPSADELGAELERFLAEHRENGGDGPRG
jgi:hypothetical protein